MENNFNIKCNNIIIKNLFLILNNISKYYVIFTVNIFTIVILMSLIHY